MVRALLLFTGVLAFGTAAAVTPTGDRIEIQFGSVDRVALFEGPVAQPVKVQGILGGSAPAKCELRRPAGAADLIDFHVPAGLTPGFFDKQDLLGIREVSGGVPCGRVGADGQFLKLTLGDDVPALRLVVGTTLNFNIRNNVLIRIEANGPFGTSVYEVRSGSYRTGAPSSGPIAPDGVFNCGPKESCRVQLEGAAWSELTLTTANDQAGKAGEWSLGSGNSVFMLGEVETIGCTGSDDDLVEADNVVLRRLVDLDLFTNEPNAADCRPLPYRVGFNGREFQFLVDYSVLDYDGDGVPDRDPTFELIVNWAEERVALPAPPIVVYPDEGCSADPVGSEPACPPTVTSSVGLSWQQFLPEDFTFGGVTYPADDAYFIDACLGQPTYEGGVLTGLILEDPLEPDPRDMSSFPGLQYGCYLSRQIDVLSQLESALCPVTESGDPASICIRLTEVIYVRGDYFGSRVTRGSN